MFLAVVIFVLTFPLVARGAEGGYSNYIPGAYGDFGMALEPPKGLTVRNDTYYYNAKGSGDLRGTQIGVDGDLTFKLNLTTLLYNTNYTFLGGSYAFGGIIPVVDYDLDAGVSWRGYNTSSSDSASGLGDIALIPIMLFWNYDNWHFSFGEFIVTPTGSYDKDAAINEGLNYYSFDTNFAATYLNETTGQDYSVNLGHIYNTENKDTNYKTGQEVHVDVALNQFFSDTFAVGIQGYYHKQVTGDRMDSRAQEALLGDFKGESAGVGPAVMWTTNIFNNDVHFIGKWLNEFTAENRIKGDHIYFSFVTTL